MDTASVLQRFAGLPFTVEAELGNLTLTIGEILTLQEGSILRTDHPAGVPFTLRAGGAEFASAEVVVIDDTLSMRVNSLIDKPQPGGAANGIN